MQLVYSTAIADWAIDFFNTNNMKVLFENLNMNNILSFLERNKILPNIMNVNMINTIQHNPRSVDMPLKSVNKISQLSIRYELYWLNNKKP